MRIIAGQLRGRRLFVPRMQGLRPTADLVREAIFQILTNRISIPWAEIRVLDLFAGTGALGLEALSRGARESVFVELSKVALDAIGRNIEICGFSCRAMLVRADAGRRCGVISKLVRQKGPFDIVMADPPYMQGLSEKCLKWVVQEDILSPCGILVVEEFKKTELPRVIEPNNAVFFELVDNRTYGQTRIWFYKRG
ncbi:MAG: 16S rRNA (guanine(966)-N(2))-methyltransferase RsmD [Dissulfurimicrobium sp.]|uniref:16S rRNA (guanine(966)-N(2))-methyltransferase RsmD n=1 Tax=Dissulfurimicrobium sp. TaxID=2022436 RepID=UPI00404B7689